MAIGPRSKICACRARRRFPAKCRWWWAIISMAGAGIGVWLATLLGNILLLLLGLLVWLVAWTIGMGLAVGALRNSWSSATPAVVRKKAWLGIGISVVSFALVATYIIALSVAANKLSG